MNFIFVAATNDLSGVVKVGQPRRQFLRLNRGHIVLAVKLSSNWWDSRAFCECVGVVIILGVSCMIMQGRSNGLMWLSMFFRPRRRLHKTIVQLNVACCDSVIIFIVPKPKTPVRRMQRIAQRHTSRAPLRSTPYLMNTCATSDELCLFGSRESNAMQAACTE